MTIRLPTPLRQVSPEASAIPRDGPPLSEVELLVLEMKRRREMQPLPAPMPEKAITGGVQSLGGHPIVGVLR
jgi:hypothetical protein